MSLDEERIIRSMVRTLRNRPAEWLTFVGLSRLVALADCDANVLGAIAEYRSDLFAITKDRKLKLRQNVIEDVARRGIENWSVPARPEPAKHRDLDYRDITARRESGVGCYCKSSYEEILNDIKGGSPPDEALLRSCCWSAICRVRGMYFNMIDPEIWRDICQRRGYIRQRENPRGF